MVCSCPGAAPPRCHGPVGPFSCAAHQEEPVACQDRPGHLAGEGEAFPGAAAASCARSCKDARGPLPPCAGTGCVPKRLLIRKQEYLCSSNFMPSVQVTQKYKVPQNTIRPTCGSIHDYFRSSQKPGCHGHCPIAQPVLCSKVNRTSSHIRACSACETGGFRAGQSGTTALSKEGPWRDHQDLPSRQCLSVSGGQIVFHLREFISDMDMEVMIASRSTECIQSH